jgi:Ca-activated chloride channel family protein
MSFQWSSLLVLLLLIPLIVVAYILVLRRRRRYAVRYSSLSLVRDSMTHQSWLRRHLPFVLFLLALTSLVLALARPTASVMVPSNKATIILALDVSRSMCSTDIQPNRLRSAQDAALKFVRDDRSGRQIGIVAFAGFAELIQPPTDNLNLLEAAIESLSPARRTAVGSAILRSIDAIAEIDERVAPSDISSTAVTRNAADEFVPHIIVLLTDGATNAGPPPAIAADQAFNRGIRVYTIGFGTTRNTSPMNCGDQSQEFDPFFGGGFGSPFSGGGGGGGGFRREIDEEALIQIADLTGGTYYAATSADELQNVFKNLPTYLIATRENIEISAFFTIAATLLAVLAMVLSFRLYPLG